MEKRAIDSYLAMLQTYMQDTSTSIAASTLVSLKVDLRILPVSFCVLPKASYVGLNSLGQLLFSVFSGFLFFELGCFICIFKIALWLSSFL